MNHKKEENTMINITFPDGNVKQFENGITAEAIAQSISLCGSFNGSSD